MNKLEFDKHLDKRIQQIRDTLGVKAKEYVRNDNPLHNFEVGGQITGETTAKVLDGFLLKHIVSYRDMINDLEKGIIPDKAKVEEKLGDIINYFIIQEGILYDEINKRIASDGVDIVNDIYKLKE